MNTVNKCVDSCLWGKLTILLFAIALMLLSLSGCNSVSKYDYRYDAKGRLTQATYYYDDGFTLGGSEGEGKTLLELNIKGIGL